MGGWVDLIKGKHERKAGMKQPWTAFRKVKRSSFCLKHAECNNRINKKFYGTYATFDLLQIKYRLQNLVRTLKTFISASMW